VFTRRLARRLGWERNEMRRASDRIETWLTVSLLVVFVAAAVWAGGAAARMVYRADLRQQTWNRTHLFHVEAVLLEDPVVPGTADDAGSPVTPPMARARWTVPGGSQRVGIVQVAPDDRAGSRVATWIDDHGALSGPPGEVSPHTDAGLGATAAVLCLAAALFFVRQVVRGLLYRRRIRSWHQEWLEVGPRWSRHR
jgi:hypothetical protein